MKEATEDRRNPKGVNIEKRIKSGETKFFTFYMDALEHSKIKGSYAERCYRDGIVVGFTVPN